MRLVAVTENPPLFFYRTVEISMVPAIEALMVRGHFELLMPIYDPMHYIINNNQCSSMH